MTPLPTGPAPILLDGPMGTELERHGVPTPLPAWSAAALDSNPDVVARIHRAYADAGATVHTTATFRTRRRNLAGTSLEHRWDELARRSVTLCREAIPADHRVAGGLAPLEDCYHPERTPPDDALAAEHADLARVLADAGCDLLLVETMPTTRELLAAVKAARATGLPTWAAVTLGPSLDFFDAAELLAARDACAALGAEAFLLNCIPADSIDRHLEAVLDDSPIAIGAFGNALFDGHTDWPPARYADAADRWRALGATILGACCGTGPEHVAELARRHRI